MSVLTAAETASMLGYNYKYFQHLKKHSPGTLPPSIKISPRKEIWLLDSVINFLTKKEATQNQI